MSADPVNNQSPQLVMCREQLSELPGLCSPGGFCVRAFQEGDAVWWDRILSEAFGWVSAEGGGFEMRMRSDPSFRPERVWFVCRGDEPVGSASAWPGLEYGQEAGVLHYVGVIKRELGHGLGSLVSLAALHQMVREQRTHALLRTDDCRLPAIRLYLKLGFAPFLIHENQRQRWYDIFQEMQRTDLVTVFDRQLEGPIERPRGA